MKADSSPLRIEQVHDATVVAFAQPSLVDPVVLSRVGEQLYGLIDEQGRRRIAVDFADVRFLSSQTLAILLTLRKKADAAGGRVVICGMKADLHKVFKITKLESFFDFFATRAEALAALGCDELPGHGGV
jgi:anti-sigma B factor antagonist